MQSSRDFLNELGEFVGGEVTHGPEVETLFRPMANIIALDRPDLGPGILGAQPLRDE